MFDALPAWGVDSQIEVKDRRGVRHVLPAGHEGPRARIVISPGAIRVERRDRARLERSRQRAIDRHALAVSELAGQLNDLVEDEEGRLFYRDEFLLAPEPRREVTEFSRKSRANMWEAFHQLDYHPMLELGGMPAMVTLTYPGAWLDVAADAKQVKRHLLAFRKRFERAWDRPLYALWKLEFQDRGAPHYHLFMVVPRGRAQIGRSDEFATFRRWLSATWADVVAHPDPDERRKNESAGTRVDVAKGLQATDPRRVAVYFAKHGTFVSKEYQHVVPDAWKGPGKGPGRFWGYWHLKRARAAVEVSPDDAIAAARLIRRWSRAQGVTRQVTVWRTKGGRVRPGTWDVVGLAGAQYAESHAIARPRKVRRRVERLRNGAGWCSFNDGAAFASEIARYLAQRAESRRWEQLLGQRRS